jgi:hypothetical protein
MQGYYAISHTCTIWALYCFSHQQATWWYTLWSEKRMARERAHIWVSKWWSNPITFQTADSKSDVLPLSTIYTIRARRKVWRKSDPGDCYTAHWPRVEVSSIYQHQVHPQISLHQDTDSIWTRSFSKVSFTTEAYCKFYQVANWAWALYSFPPAVLCSEALKRLC